MNNIIDKNMIAAFVENHAGALVLKTGETINYGVIKVEDGNLICYTGRGLREIWPHTATDEQKAQAIVLRGQTQEQLIQSHHIAKIPLVEIQSVLF